MKKLSYLIGCCLLLSLSAMADISPVYTYKMQHLLDSLCVKYHIKGVSAAIYIPGDGMWKGAYGESEVGVPITTDMYLPIGSNTKTFTSAIILKLQENSMLSIDDTIGTWIKNQPNISGQITIRQLLNHTSGLYSYTDNPGFFTAFNSDYNKVWQPEEMFQFVDAPLNPPGAKWEYCNTNYLLLGMIIKQVTGLPLEKAYQDMVFTPLQLNHAVFYPNQQPNGIIPHGWTTGSGPIEDMQVTYGYSNTAFLSMATSAGAIVATAEDVAMFWHNLMTGKLINSNSLTQMKTVIKLSNNVSYGLGIFRTTPVNGRIVYGHGGTCFGYINENLVDTISGVCITALSNQDSIDNDFLFSKIVTPLHKLVISMPPAGIADVQDNNAVHMYPNPASSYVYVQTNSITKNTVFELCDMTGRVVMQTMLNSAVEKVPLSGMSTGLYLARILQNGTPVQTQKLQVVQ